MKSIIKKIMVMLLVPISLWAGGSVGNGGGAWTCRDANQNLAWIKFVDFFEAENEFGLDLENQSFVSYQGYLNLVLAKVKTTNQSFYYALKASLTKVNDNFKLVDNSDLSVIDDALYRITPSNSSCSGGKVAYEQVANYTNYGKILVNNSLFKALTVQEQAGLHLHEAIYLLERNRKSATNSVNTRSLVGLLMSQLDVKEYADQLNGYSPTLDSKECDICTIPQPAGGRFSDGLAAFQTAKGWGYMDSTGKVIIEPQFHMANEFHEGRAAVAYYTAETGDYWQNVKWKFIDKKGNTVFDTQYSIIPSNFENGLARVYAKNPKDTGLFTPPLNAVINLNGAVIVEYQENNFGLENGIIVFENPKEKSCKYLNAKKEVILTLAGYEYCGGFSEGLARVTKDGLSGYVNSKGDLIIGLKFKSARQFVNGFAVVSEKEQSLGLINKTGQYVVQPFIARDAFNFNKVIVVKDFSIGQGKFIPYGVLNLKGELVSYTGFTEIPFNESNLTEPLLIPVKLNNKWGYMNAEGKIVIEPQFNTADYFHEGFAVTDKGYIDINQID